MSKPDIIIVDLTLKNPPGGLELLGSLKREHPDIPALVLSMHDEALFAERALRAGARGYIMKSEGVDELKRAINQVLDGKIYLSHAMSDRLLESAGQGSLRWRSPQERLSPRELEVFELTGRGKPVREIAETLHISVKTVETHRAHIKEKLGFQNATELLQQATHWASRSLDTL